MDRAMRGDQLVENAGVDFLRGKEPDELMAWIDNYCQRNPVHRRADRSELDPLSTVGDLASAA